MDKSCWQILGIEQTADKREIRRAYAKKLKMIDPEIDPKAFITLREALGEALDSMSDRLFNADVKSINFVNIFASNNEAQSHDCLSKQNLNVQDIDNEQNIDNENEQLISRQDDDLLLEFERMLSDPALRNVLLLPDSTSFNVGKPATLPDSIWCKICNLDDELKACDLDRQDERLERLGAILLEHHVNTGPLLQLYNHYRAVDNGAPYTSMIHQMIVQRRLDLALYRRIISLTEFSYLHKKLQTAEPGEFCSHDMVYGEYLLLWLQEFYPSGLLIYNKESVARLRQAIKAWLDKGIKTSFWYRAVRNRLWKNGFLGLPKLSYDLTEKAPGRWSPGIIQLIAFLLIPYVLFFMFYGSYYSIKRPYHSEAIEALIQHEVTDSRMPIRILPDLYKRFDNEDVRQLMKARLAVQNDNKQKIAQITSYALIFYALFAGRFMLRGRRWYFYGLSGLWLIFTFIVFMTIAL